MSEHGHEYRFEHEQVGRGHIPYYKIPQRFPFPHHMQEYGGYRLPPTREEELEILEKWKVKMEEAKTGMDKKLARIEQRIEELKKEA